MSCTGVIGVVRHVFCASVNNYYSAFALVVVSQALRENTYPFLAMIVLKNSRMTVVARIEGAIGAAELVQALGAIKEDNEMYLIAARAERYGVF